MDDRVRMSDNGTLYLDVSANHVEQPKKTSLLVRIFTLGIKLLILGLFLLGALFFLMLLTFLIL